MKMSTVLLDANTSGGGGGYTEAQLVVLVLAVLVIAVALLSYFVVAPEYEKHLEKQYAAAFAAHERDSCCSFASTSSAVASASNERYLALTRKKLTKLTKHRSLGCWDMEAASSSDDDAYDHHLQHMLRQESIEDDNAAREHMGREGLTSMSMSCSPPLSMNSALLHRSSTMTDAQRQMLARRRKSESDALKLANVNRAEMLRRRVLLKKLEEEIKGAIKENDASSNSTSSSSSVPSSLRGDVRRSSNDALYLTEDKLKMLQDHPADCAQELSILAGQPLLLQQLQLQPESQHSSTAPPSGVTSTATSTGAVDQDALSVDTSSNEVKQALQTLHDVLSFYLSSDHRDMHKLTVFCNSLLAHDGLNHLRAFEVSVDADVRALANAIIEKAVPAIWH